MTDDRLKQIEALVAEMDQSQYAGSDIDGTGNFGRVVDHAQSALMELLAERVKLRAALLGLIDADGTHELFLATHAATEALR